MLGKKERKQDSSPSRKYMSCGFDAINQNWLYVQYLFSQQQFKDCECMCVCVCTHVIISQIHHIVI